MVHFLLIEQRYVSPCTMLDTLKETNLEQNLMYLIQWISEALDFLGLVLFSSTSSNGGGGEFMVPNFLNLS